MASELGPVGHVRRFFTVPFADSLLPEWSLRAAGTVVPFAELTGGTLVLLDIWRLAGLMLLGGVLVTATFVHLLTEPFYAFNAHVIPGLVLLVRLFVMPRSWDRFSVDEWRTRRTWMEVGAEDEPA